MQPLTDEQVQLLNSLTKEIKCMIFLHFDDLEFHFHIHEDADFSVSFQRALRLPNNNRPYPLLPELEHWYFDIHDVDDFCRNVPADWLRHGGVFLPMYQAEALQLEFRGYYPMALKVGTGNVCALTGEPWSPELVAEPQNYMVIPDQSCLLRQFVAMPLGDSYAAGEQSTEEIHQYGDLQIVAYPMKAEVYRDLLEEPETEVYVDSMSLSDREQASGGLTHPEIHDDKYGLAAWDLSARSRCFVYVLNSVQYHAITGKLPPSAPPSAEDFAAASMPWFEYYADDSKALESLPILARQNLVEHNETVLPQKICTLKGLLPNPKFVRWGDF